MHRFRFKDKECYGYLQKQNLETVQMDKNKLISMFVECPYQGSADGDLLEHILSWNKDEVFLYSSDELIHTIQTAEENFTEYDWEEQESQGKFMFNLQKFKDFFE